MSSQHHLPSYKASLPVTENYPCCRTYRHRALSLHLRTQVASSSCLTWRCCVRCCSRFNALIVARRPCVLGRPVQWWAMPWRLLWRAGAVVVSCRVYSHHRGWRLIPTNPVSPSLSTTMLCWQQRRAAFARRDWCGWRRWWIYVAASTTRRSRPSRQRSRASSTVWRLTRSATLIVQSTECTMRCTGRARVHAS